jgi:hypothetical protein
MTAGRWTLLATGGLLGLAAVGWLGLAPAGAPGGRTAAGASGAGARAAGAGVGAGRAAWAAGARGGPRPPAFVAPAPGAAAAGPREDAGRARAEDAGRARALVDRLARVLGQPDGDERERARRALEAELAALGEAAAGPLIARLDAAAGEPAGVREALFDLLRRTPGAAAEARLIDEARRGAHDTTRTMAIEALAQRHTDGALEALAAVADSDPLLPAQPFLGGERRPDDSSTELPDERVFTPRMQAMAALAGTRDPRAVALLADVARRGPDESLRMEAARHLGPLRDDARALAALRAAAGDRSPVVRLAALHALRGSDDAGLPALLARIAAGDRDAGVRALAREMLAGGR